MSIGQHKIGKLFLNVRNQVYSGFGGVFSKKVYTTEEFNKYNVDGVTAEALPKAPANPFRKRPTKIIYDKNEYHMFKLPSEKHFLLSGFDYETLFGYKKGMSHSSHLKA